MTRSIFSKTDHEEIVKRLDTLTPASKAAWGKMNVAQMLSHCNYIHKLVLGKVTPDKSPNFLLRFIIKRVILSPKPYKPGLPTGPSLLITDAKDFEREKQEMKQYLKDIYSKGTNYDWKPHPAAGKLTGDQWGWAMWKHLDHHFRQFSC